jgi:hypothetical protein
MAFSSSSYQMLKSISIATKTNIDTEPNVAYSSTSRSPNSCASSEFSSAYISPNFTPTHEQEFWKKSPSQFDSLDLSNIRVKVPPIDPWSFIATATTSNCGNASMNFTNNLTNDNFISKNESSAMEFSFMSSALSDITYAPLSSYNDTVYGSQNSALQYEIMRQEFEMNGTTSEMLPPFEPTITSTPSSSSERRGFDDFSSIEESFELNLTEWRCNNFQAGLKKRKGFEARLQKIDFKSSRFPTSNAGNYKRGNKPSKKSLGNVSFGSVIKNFK